MLIKTKKAYTNFTKKIRSFFFVAEERKREIDTDVLQHTNQTHPLSVLLLLHPRKNKQLNLFS